MKKYVIVFLIVIFSPKIHAAHIENLNHSWKFFNANQTAGDNAVEVNLPHTWNTDALGAKSDYLREVGNYLKEVNIPAEWAGRRVFIRFKGANSMCSLIINGRHVGQHRGGYTPFTFELTDFLNYGSQNAFWVIVNNSSQFDILPTAGDANSYGGLIRGVELVVTEPVTIALTDYSSQGVYISSRRNPSGNAYNMETVVKVSSALDKTVQVGIALVDPQGRIVAEQSDKLKVSPKALAAVTFKTTVENPMLWNGIKNPYLYNVRVKVWEDGTIYDSVVVRTGFREISFDHQKGFMLNGQPYRLRGVTLTQDRAMVGTALQPHHVEEDVALVREMGANIVCVSGVPHTPEFYSLCDRAGIMVWSELPFVGAAYLTDRAWFNTPAFRQNGRDQLTEIIRQQFNHPSVVMWGIFNCLSQKGDDPIDYVKELNALAKKEDPSRYTVCTSNQDGSINFVTDLVCWRHRYGWNEGMPSDIAVWLPYLHRTWSNLSSAVSYGAGASIDQQCDSLYRPSPSGIWHPERWQTYLHEEYFKYTYEDGRLWATFANNMFDYGAAGRNGGINDMGLITFDRKYRKDAFYFYKANWNVDDPFVYIAEKRWSTRASLVQHIKVYSNCNEVELVVNGISLGAQKGVNGTFVWKDVALSPGYNKVEAHSGTLSDTAAVRIDPGSAKHF